MTSSCSAAMSRLSCHAVVSASSRRRDSSGAHIEFLMKPILARRVSRSSTWAMAPYLRPLLSSLLRRTGSDGSPDGKIYPQGGARGTVALTAQGLLGLEAFDHRAVESEAGAARRPAWPAAAIDRDREGAGLQAAMMAIEAANDLAKPGIRLGQVEKAGAAPPEAVMLRGQRSRRIDTGMDEQQLIVAGKGGATECGQEIGMAGRGIDGLPQRIGPACDRYRPLARCGQPVFRIGPVSADRRADAVVEHPAQHLDRIGRQLQLQQFLPHLFLAAAPVNEIRRKCCGARNEGAAKRQQLGHGIVHRGT